MFKNKTENKVKIENVTWEQLHRILNEDKKIRDNKIFEDLIKNLISSEMRVNLIRIYLDY